MTAVGICTSVVSGAKILVRDRLMKVPDTTTLAEPFEKVKPEGKHVDHEDVVVKYSSRLASNWIDTELEKDLGVVNDLGVVVNDFGFKYIRFTQDSLYPPSSKRACTVNDVLMGVARDRTKLPCKKVSKNKKEELFNDVRGFCEGRQIGFSPSAADSEGYVVVNCLTNHLWMIDTNFDTLEQASSKKGPTKVPKVPEVWKRFAGYNDYKSKKKVKPRLNETELRQTAVAYISLCSLYYGCTSCATWISNGMWHMWQGRIQDFS